MYISDTDGSATAAAECTAENRKAGAGSLRTGMIYLAASLVIAAAAAVYGLFSHGVYSYWMTYAFMIPLLLGAVPHLLAALKEDAVISSADVAVYAAKEETSLLPAPEGAKTCQGEPSLLTKLLADLWTGDVQIAVIAVLTTGSLLKGALDIYGTTNRLLIAYPVIAVLTVIGTVILAKRGESKTPGGPADDTVEIIETAE